MIRYKVAFDNLVLFVYAEDIFEALRRAKTVQEYTDPRHKCERITIERAGF